MAPLADFRSHALYPHAERRVFEAYRVEGPEFALNIAQRIAERLGKADG